MCKSITQEDLRELHGMLEVKESKLSVNIGRRVLFQRTGQKVAREGTIIAVQSIWGYNEQGQYVWGIEGYTLEDGTAPHFTIACNPDQLKFI